MSLEVKVVCATNVPNPETFGKSDPYASVEFQGIKKKTEVIKGDLNPKWDQDNGSTCAKSTKALQKTGTRRSLLALNKST
ncbi:dysferlin [Elysia marginata]|uniref:Dysferlin n=1 Tax=Elysia marginata TaxID=1093978 RepID=A0AAV4G2B4_9GAST|nr:dysferlin [Elysia marginata]